MDRFSLSEAGPMGIALLILLCASLLMLIISIIITFTHPFSRRKRGAIGPAVAIFIYLATVLQIGLLVFSFMIYSGFKLDSQPHEIIDVPTVGHLASQTVAESETTEQTVPPTTTEPPIVFTPAHTADTNPENFGINWEVFVNGELVDNYQREEEISFGQPEDYFALPGVATFRGNNYRNDPTYGTVEITNASLKRIWSHRIGMFNNWTGCAWTGQPLLAQWDDDTKSIMNLYESKKNKEGLVEVIYGILDGSIHFYDLEDGTETRDPIVMNMNFKGAGALDPRGYPILYIGGGLNVGSYRARMYAVSLIDGSILWEYGNSDPEALRNWTAFDSSPLVDAETDTLIWPGESGILYTVKLNTAYDKEAGTLTLNPDPVVKTRYTSQYTEENRYLGYEASVCIVDDYLYTSENGGLFFCVDLNSMELIWAQDTKDDSNSSPLFDWEDEGKGYLYTAPSLHWTATANKGTVSVYKLDASTGEIIWEYPFECSRDGDVSGGVQASPLLGEEGTEIEDLVIYTLARAPSLWKGRTVALNKYTGELVWESDSGNYAWSSPIAFYNEDGKAYLFTANASGICRILDGATGEVLTVYDLGETTEASPVAFNDMIVLGTRQGVYGFKIS